MTDVLKSEVLRPVMLSREENEAVLSYLQTVVPQLRDRRKHIETGWLNFHAAWLGIKTRFYYTDGTADHYIPAARRSIERFVSRARKQLIPSQEFFEVYPWDESSAEDGKSAESVRAYLLYLFVKHIRLRQWIDQILRCYLLYGRAIVKNSVRFIDQSVLTRSESNRVFVSKTKQTVPFSRVVDPFNFWFWPESATSIEETQLIIEDTMMPISDYENLARNKEVEPLDFSKLGKPQWHYAHTQRLGQSGLTEPSTLPTQPDKQGRPRGADFIHISECWFRRDGELKQVWIAWNTESGPKIVRARAPEYPEAPYRMSIARSLPGEGYTTSMMADLEPMQVWLNDSINIAQDAQFTTMSPPAIINPGLVYRHDSLTWRPRAKWFVDPQGVTFPTIPDTSRSGIMLVQMINGFLESFSGGNSLAEGQPQRGMPRAGYAVSTLVGLATADMTAVAEMVEDNILTPTLSDLFRLAMIFLPPEQAMQIPPVMGLPARSVTPSALYGDWTFRWVGSLQSQDMNVKSQRLLTMTGILAKAGPMVQQQGLKINWKLLLKRLWRDSLGERGADSILEDMTPEDAVLSMIMSGSPMVAGGPQQVPGVANPANPEAAQQSDARSMGESQVGRQMAGLGV